MCVRVRVRETQRDRQRQGVRERETEGRERERGKSLQSFVFSVCLFVCLFCLFAISWAAPMAYGGSQARGRIGAIAASLRQSHSNVGSEPCLRPTPQLTATLDP